MCKGKGVIEIPMRIGVDCMVVWDTDERFGNTIAYTEAGSEGASTVILQTDPKYLDLFRTSIGLVVDGVDCKVSKPPVMEGLGNQTVLVVVAFAVDKPKTDGGEIVKDYA